MDDNQIKRPISLCDALDRVLAKGVVAHGDIIISVANVDLLQISLRALIAASDALHKVPSAPQGHEMMEAR